ncbi:MAG: phosphoglycerate mutase (2,3-diphosphoglycerate-independent) [Candidatus Magasanikbacteria bacterium RIFOXYD2_FULL_36_9]|uniref:2,3-bisphosphoglycerate-independent phosphoglycerate mutase n=1 Tax=Candidatus Magasanikbacteria bacterium RIFOXYD2_FULL_36_9 TaxID=1798707 RepID=A0A1F6P1Q1_9BACT|nr:MAG: phosphoglycerate mutase (2,3-diphosphoglycerate-independent) [Candidatus Magasanikbacteria bacterium RIFOXYD2_FULL_36_9]
MPEIKTTVLVILDGWGVGRKDNTLDPIVPEHAPNYFDFLKKYPNTLLQASGEAVGLFKGQEGNSEAGHINLGAGRVVKQDGLYVSDAIVDGTFFKNNAFEQAVHHVKKFKTSIHLMGLLSNHNSAHSCPEHLYALLDLLHREKITNVYLHLFTDGRDSAQHDAVRHLENLRTHLYGNEKIATMMGRLFAMDRNKNWKRTKYAYEALVLGKGQTANGAEDALLKAYNRGETDEFIYPTIILENKKPVAVIKDNDSVIFFNLRSDRAREITKSIVQKDFEKVNPGAFKRTRVPKNIRFVALTDFGPDLPGVLTAFPSRDVDNSLVQFLCPRKQLYVAESEKFAHVTYFFNGGYAQHFCDEDWVKIPTPTAENYENIPEMNAKGVGDKVVDAINSGKYEFITCNFANADMVGHTGNFKAAQEAVKSIDLQLGRIVQALTVNKGQGIITADHGNIEEMLNIRTGGIDTEHSLNPVPCIVVGSKAKKIRKLGKLADVAPTILRMMGIKKPKEMTGKSLI